MNLTDDSTFTMPLTQSFHQVAEQFRQQQSNPQKAKQIYLNTLAVQAVKSYLEWFGVETDLDASDSWNPVLQSLTDVADLVIPHQGRLECRPVLPGTQSCYIPPEVWNDRLGYVAVQFDSELTEATLLGVVPAVRTSEVPLNELRSLDEIFDYLAPASQSESTISTQVASSLANLSRWLEDIVDAGWQSLEDLFGAQQPAFSMRGVDVEETIAEVNRGKPLSIDSYEAGVEIVLVVGILPQVDGEKGILVRVVPAFGDEYLPADLTVLILDDAGSVVMQAQSRQTEMIQLRFTGLLGERFDVQIVLGNDCITESFVI